MADALPHLPAELLAAENDELLAAQAADTADVVALPGARALLDALPADRWALVTACDRRLAEARLRAAGLPLPAVMVTPADVARGKPDPEGHLAAAAALGAEPARCVVLEDAPSGVEAAQAAGMAVVAVLTTHDMDQVAAADLVVDGLDELVVEGCGPFSLRVRRALRPR
jgi:sugar-phosphatase